MRKTLKVLSALLSYPTAELQAAVPEMRAALDAEARLPQKNRDRLDRLLEEIAAGDLYDLQERYVLLFDRTRSLSLHLFEHVHGESRDRGQAMVDLKALYERHGLFMSSSELPDHLPLFLEFLSQIPEAEARGLIEETAHILEAIRQRLKKRKVGVFVRVLLRAGAGASQAVERHRRGAERGARRGPQRPRRPRCGLGRGGGHLRPRRGGGRAMRQGRPRRQAACGPAAGSRRSGVRAQASRHHLQPIQPRLRRRPCATSSITSCSAGIPTSA